MPDEPSVKTSRNFPIPVSLIIIDVLGAMLVAWGFYLYVGGEGGLFHVGAGFILMMPLVVHILNLAQRKKNHNPGGESNGKF
jgi:hypothetical protein